MSESLVMLRPPGPCAVASAIEAADTLAGFLSERVASYPALMEAIAADTDKLVAACATRGCRATELRSMMRSFRDATRTAKALHSSETRNYLTALAHWRGQATLHWWLRETIEWNSKTGPRPPIPTQNFVGYIRDVVSRLDSAQAATIRPSI
jgi:hypothetical protein